MPKWQAQLTFAMARHAVVDITQIFKTAPTAPESCLTRLRAGELERIREILADSGAKLSDREDGEEKLTQLRLMYEPCVCALSEMLLMPLPRGLSAPTRSITGKLAPGEEFNNLSRL